MAVSEPLPLSDYLADDIRDQADELVEEWITWLTEGASLRPVRLLPREAIRDHVPSVIRGIAESVRSPVDAIASSLDGALGSHARLRHDQGFDIEELLKEYQGLNRIVSTRMLRTLERCPAPADPLEVGRIFLRLSEGLGEIRDLTVSVYRKTEVSHKRELHRQLEDYVRTITHELKQPLQAITAGTGMLEEEGVASETHQRKRYVKVIRDGIERAVSLIDDIRMLALVEGAQREDDWEPLESSVTLVLRETMELARRKEVQIEVKRPLPRISVDSTRTQIALMNLITNAIKYSDPDKADRWARIEVERAKPEEANRWEIRITDNGLGIPEAVQPQIFERHFRAHADREEGTGLGLAITRQTIEQGGGRIWFESEEGEGSSFHLIVPGHADESAATDSE